MAAFLRAKWRHLLMVNYAVDPSLVEARAPPGTKVDRWQGQCLVSLVAFLFGDTRVKGIPVPFHQDFEEVNLRYYIRREHVDAAGVVDVRRAVGFVKEIVPDLATAWVARLAYNENYVARPMRHELELTSGTTRDAFATFDDEVRDGGRLRYEWREAGRWNVLGARRASPYLPLVPGSEEEFIAEHYWGYVTQRDGGCVEYRVEHPPWRACRVDDLVIDVDVEAVYGPEWARALAGPPVSAFVADGSEVSVGNGTRVV